ncbi:MAG: PDZ domain-containing protein [Planctomycetes bacterium]|nr:PDZ domain-containing protein [Planctomycetota bacterium]
MWQRVCVLTVVSIAVLASGVRAQDDLNAVLEKMTKDAAKKAGASVVQIETRGGTDIIVAGPKGQTFRKALGPTTGVILTADGYIISSAFNFLNSPTIILVRIAGHAGEPLVAQRVATDKSRMLTLLKVNAKDLTVPAIVPKKDLKEGQWSIALGRALDLKMERAPAVSVGVVSALGRIWGKAIQTDAKISPVNYGGPIVDIQGRVQGILIPASPRGNDEISGFEWYDSGIGFAIPMEDVMSILPRLKLGKDLQKGLLGVAMKSQDMYSVAPTIGTVMKNSAAEKAGLRPGDVLVEIEGKAVVSMAQVLHTLGVKYEGDRITLKYQRGGEVKEIKGLELVGQTITVAHPFFGILPMRDDPRLGVEIRHVYAKSPAEKAGLKSGDRIVRFGTGDKLIDFSGAKRGQTQFTEWLNTLYPGAEIKVAVKRKGNGKTDTLSVTLGDLPGSTPGAPAAIPDKLPAEASFKKALSPLEVLGKAFKEVEQKPAMPDTGLIEKNTPDGQHKYWIYVHEDYDPQVAHALLVWLHPPNKNSKDDLEEFQELWDDYCKNNHIILVMPIEKQGTWLPSYSDYVIASARETMKTYTVDPRRVVAHGMGVGGQMALHLAFNHRDLFRGACSVGASAQKISSNVPSQRLSFYLAAGSLDPIVKTIAESRTRLAERRYPAFYREMPERGRQYLTTKDLAEAVRWLDSLDQQ